MGAYLAHGLTAQNVVLDAILVVLHAETEQLNDEPQGGGCNWSRDWRVRVALQQ